MKKLFEQKRLLRFLFWLWGLIVFVLSSLPNIPTQKINIWDELFRLDYLEHFGVFALLGSFFIAWKADSNGRFYHKNHIWFIFGTFIFAALDEIHQIWIDGRTFNPLDMIYNIAGLLVAYTLGVYVIGLFYKK